MVGRPLLSSYDALLLDLDGTVYRGELAIEGAADVVRAAREAGVDVRFVTNNASRAPAKVADRLRRLGIDTPADAVHTSAQAAAAVLAGALPAGAPVLVLGTDALAEEITAVGLLPVRSADDAVAVVQGLSEDTGWRQLAEACVAINAGARWVACNVDPTLPTERGPLVGNGSMVAALRTATEREPEVAGKPATPLLWQAVDATGARRPLVVGDRLDTDIAAANAAGMDSLLVLSGVTSPSKVLGAQRDQRPTYLADDVRGLLEPAEELVVTDQPAERSGWSVIVDDGVLLAAHVDGEPDRLALLRALCACWWRADGGTRPGIRAADATTKATLSKLSLTDVVLA